MFAITDGHAKSSSTRCNMNVETSFWYTYTCSTPIDKPFACNSYWRQIQTVPFLRTHRSDATRSRHLLHPPSHSSLHLDKSDGRIDCGRSPSTSSWLGEIILHFLLPEITTLHLGSLIHRRRTMVTRSIENKLLPLSPSTSVPADTRQPASSGRLVVGIGICSRKKWSATNPQSIVSLSAAVDKPSPSVGASHVNCFAMSRTFLARHPSHLLA